MIRMVNAAMLKPIRILLVDDHRCILWGLDKLISGAWPPMQVVAAVTNAVEALAAAAQHSPDLVLLDLDLGDTDGLDLLSDLTQQCDAKVLIVTATRDPHLRELAILRGARGIVHKVEPVDLILKAIEHVHRGEIWLDRATMAKVIAAVSGDRRAQKGGLEDAQCHTLTRRERQIIAAVVVHRGASIKMIAESLNVSIHTVSNHLASIYSKLNLHSRLELFMYAKEHRLDKAGP